MIQDYRITIRLLVLAGVAVAAGPAIAAPPVKPYLEVTYSSYAQGNTQLMRQFDPAKGTLISARAESWGSVTYTIVPNGPLTKPTPYAFTASFYLYFGPASFHLSASGSDTLAAYTNPLIVTAKGKNSETFTGAALGALKGKGTIPVTFSADLPKPPPPGVEPGSIQATKFLGSVSVTYRYIPTISKLPPTKTLPKKPVIKTLPH
jgi:hypothetical protein